MKVFILKLSRLGGTHASRRACFPLRILRLGEAERCRTGFVWLYPSKVMCWELNPKCNVSGTSTLYWIPRLLNCKQIHLCSLSITQLFPSIAAQNRLRKQHRHYWIISWEKLSPIWNIIRCLHALNLTYFQVLDSWQRSVLCFLIEVRPSVKHLETFQHSTCLGSDRREIRASGTFSKAHGASECVFLLWPWHPSQRTCRDLKFSSDKVGLILARIPEPNRTIKWGETSLVNDYHGPDTGLHLYTILPILHLSVSLKYSSPAKFTGNFMEKKEMWIQ